MSLLALWLLVLVLHVKSQSDLQCLTQFRQSVTDPNDTLSNWKNGSCLSSGVTCLHILELKVYQLTLPGAGLGGTFPEGLDKCSSLTGLFLSGNSFTGPIPSTICKMLPYLVKLDLSGNLISGPLPDFSGCQYLNELHLQENAIEGNIPPQIGLLPRLSDLNVSDNKLAGQVPDTLARFTPDSFKNNKGLCGTTVSRKCSGKSSSTGVIVGTVVGGAVLIVALTGIIAYIVVKRKKPQKMKDDTTWSSKIKSPRTILVSMFEKPLVGIKFSDLIAATDNFSRNNVISDGATGVSYKATLRDGSVLAVRRLSASSKSEQQFRTEMDTLGHVYHANLVPLLGFCIAGSERLLIYKHMDYGSLWNWLFEVDAGERLDWPARLKIALGASRGLAFLHHSCIPRILHRNISPHTILLDDDFESRITDFGLARLIGSSSGNSVHHDVLRDMGDPGHVAPEYARVPVATTKGDVYSFGVVLLELLTSQKPLDISMGDFKGSLVEWIGMLRTTGRLSEALDKSLSGRGADEELVQTLKVACGCVLSLPNDRPSMYEVFQQLKKIAEPYDFTDPDDDIPVATSNESTEFPRVS